MPNGMSTARMTAAPRFRLVLVTSLLGWAYLSACGADGDTLVPVVEATRPAPGEVWPADRPLTVIYGSWLDPRTVRDGVATLSSGELETAVGVAYDPVGPAVMVYPLTALRPGLGYTLTLDGARLTALGGDVGGATVTVGFRAGPVEGWSPPPAPSDGEMADLFARRCGCHGPAPAASPALTREAMVGVPARRRPDRLLVEPGRPLDSELVLRVLPDHPGVRGMEKTLTDDERRQIIRWVEHL